MPEVTYLPGPHDSPETETFGLRFRANVPTSVPEGHGFLAMVEGNPFFTLGDGRRAPGRPKAPKPPSTPEEYFPYAVAWLKEAKSSGEIESRWANEEPMRKSLDPAWGSSDDDKLEPIKGPIFDTLVKRERESGQRR